MRRSAVALLVLFVGLTGLRAQSGRTTGYSESGTAQMVVKSKTGQSTNSPTTDDRDVVRVATDLVTIPVRITDRSGKSVPNLRQAEFRIYENGVAQEVAYFSNEEQPFTVALVLDTSYSTVFRLDDIQTAARIFTLKLREHDRVIVVSFDERPQVLCESTNDRRILQMAITGSRIGSGTALYDTLGLVREKLSSIPGRKAIVLLTDGVDTSSQTSEATRLMSDFASEDVIVYPIQYDTFDDVQRSRRKSAEIKFDENDLPYVVKAAPGKGERAQDYDTARGFLSAIATETGGRVHPVSTTTNLNDAFSRIADELRRIYSIGYYPTEDRKSGAVYGIKVRVYRSDLKITARNH